MKFDFPFKKWTESLDGVTQSFADTREIYAHCISSNTKRKQMKATVLGWIICAASLY